MHPIILIETGRPSSSSEEGGKKEGERVEVGGLGASTELHLVQNNIINQYSGAKSGCNELRERDSLWRSFIQMLLDIVSFGFFGMTQRICLQALRVSMGFQHLIIAHQKPTNNSGVSVIQDESPFVFHIANSSRTSRCSVFIYLSFLHTYCLSFHDIHQDKHGRRHNQYQSYMQ